MAEPRDGIVELRESFDQGRLRYLVGLGTSIAAGHPDPRSIERALLRAVFAEDVHLRHLCAEDAALDAVANSFVDRFGPDGVVEGVRQALAPRTSPAASTEDRERHLAEMLREALYDGRRERLLDPLHNELAAALLDPRYEGKARAWSFNVDDLLTSALAAAGATDARVIAEPGGEQGGRGPELVHLRGYLPRTGAARGPILGSERDLFGSHGKWQTAMLEEALLGPADVLLVGVSLTDPGVRRLLAMRLRASPRPSAGRVYALLGKVSRDAGRPPGATVLERFADRMATDAEPSLWRSWEVEPIVLEDRELWPHALRRIRLGVDPAGWATRASKWLAARGAYDGLYEEKRQRASHGLMRSMIRHLRSRFAIPREEEIHLGIHVPAQDDPRQLRIAFHFVGEQEGVSLLPNLLTEATARLRELSIGSTGEPEGATGHAFVTGTVVASQVGDGKLHENFSPEKADRWQGPRTFQSLLAVPAYVVEAGHLPVGVIYLDSNRRRPFWAELDQDDYHELCTFSSRMCISMLRGE
jgi:hypothetical protein